MANQSKPYAVERSEDGCLHCGTGGTWDVIGPDDVAIGVSFHNRDDADEIAEWMSRAYWAGTQCRADEKAELIAALRNCVAALEEHGVHLPANTHWEDDYRAWWTSQNSPDGRGIPDQGCSECAAIVRARAVLARAEA